MNSLPDELVLSIFHFLDLYAMAYVRRITHSYKLIAQDYSLSTMTRIRGSLRDWKTSFPKLKTANIRSRKKITPNDLSYLQDVEYLDMYHCVQLFHPDTFSNFSNLKCLDIQHGIFTDNIFDHLIGLTKLCICNNKCITDSGIKKLVNLEKLYIHNCWNITNEGLSGLTKLVELNTYNMGFTDDLFKSLVNLTHLEITFEKISTAGICQLQHLTYLTVHGCSHVNTCNGFQHLPLNKLHITCCPINDNDMTYINHIHSIQFYDTPYIHGEQFDQLTHVRNLSVFKLSIWDGVINVCTLKNLTCLNMYDCRQSPEITEKLMISLSSKFHTD
jgi:hypothetical protein